VVPFTTVWQQRDLNDDCRMKEGRARAVASGKKMGPKFNLTPFQRTEVLRRLPAARQPLEKPLRLAVETAEGSALQRTEELVDRLDARVAMAQRAGALGFLNREFRQRRLQAQAEGRGFMSYGAAQALLRKALVGVAAGDAPAIIARVFAPKAQ
jgi:hypothetical protein